LPAGRRLIREPTAGGDMKAAIVRESGQPLVIEDRPVPEPGPGNIQDVLQGKAKARLVLTP
jgi:D-arabinose 1-dehydrogenase-like Zn-dependent alcohol dehydrogenase